MNLIILCLSLLLVEASHDLSGEWKMKVFLNPDSEPFETQLELKQTGTKLEGVWTPGVKDHASPVCGSLEGDSVEFVARPTHGRYQGSEFRFTGTVHYAGFMSGDLRSGKRLRVRWEASQEKEYGGQ